MREELIHAVSGKIRNYEDENADWVYHLGDHWRTAKFHQSSWEYKSDNSSFKDEWGKGVETRGTGEINTGITFKGLSWEGLAREVP